MLVTASTILDTPANVRRFVADNLAMGVDHMVVFLDDPQAPDQDQVADELSRRGQVTCVPTGRDWWAGDRPQGLNVRQRINVNLALQLLTGFEWAQWVFHIDGDEVVAVDREVLSAVPADADAVWLTPLECVSQFGATERPTLFKRLLDDEDLNLLHMLGVVSAPTNSAYFHGHVLGKSGVRPGSGLRLTLHDAVTTSGDKVPRHEDPRLRVLHHDAVSGEEFIRKWTALLGAGPARFRKDRAPTVNALRTLTGKDIPAPIAEKYLRRIYEATTEDDVTTLHDLGLLEEVDPGRGTHVPQPIAESDRETLVQRFAEVRDVPKRPFHVIQRPGPAKAKSRRQRLRGLRARVRA
ncbi:MAG TPA: glycosyltransferase family 2 protein [Nocardioides sp.]|nr:glycosyltransferase family 2 protein [Nocardioides sp.]